MKILILNDEESLQEMMLAVLTKAGHEIEAAGDGDTAMRRYCERGPYDLVLSDVLHPGMHFPQLSYSDRTVHQKLMNIS